MAKESKEIDAIDLRIIGILQRDGRISWKDLGERVHLSATATADRVRRLERLGVIAGYHVHVDPTALGRTVRALIDVVLPGGADPAAFEAKLRDRDEIAFAAFVTGAADYELIVECTGADGLDEVIRWLKTGAGAARTESKVVLRSIVG
jgi:Lrp/AsnC family leucine-responsive transcriptional regulator